MSDSFGAVILAAGQGTRLKLDVAKPLAPILGQKLVDFPMKEAFSFFKDVASEGVLTLVTGHERDKVESHVLSLCEKNNVKVNFAIQEKQLGTADALRSYFSAVDEAKNYDYTIVLCADTPLLRAEDIQKLYTFIKNKNLLGAAATFEETRPTGYGRIVRASKGFHIVEEKDADANTKLITEVNSGVYVLKTSFVLEHLNKIDSNNKSGEFYLTDLFKDEYEVGALCFDDKDVFLGVNTLEQLETAEGILRQRNMNELRSNGVRFIDTKSTYVDSLNVGQGTTIYPNVFIDEETIVGSNVIIEPGVILRNSTIEDGVHIKAYSHFENSIVRKDAVVGPYARLRPGTDVGEESKIGNFVEIKKSKLDKGVKVSHLSYVGDAEIGEESNIGCGFITCNYDGANKHKTIIGKGSFIGSDSQTVAPVNIGDNCFVASSSTVTNDMPDGSFAISRGKQTTKEGMAKRFLKSK
jgi:bifunctional UDP-N-acetylglucosamine pyrophosphorylase/glucosamine-1-phosphate N-acetyltransferase